MVSRRIALGLCALLPAGLLAQSEEFGKWRDLFNGKDLTGWKTAKPGQAGGKNLWTVEDGALTNERGGVNDICTVEEFKDYELDLEFKVLKGGNSGVYLRGRVEVQVLDSYGKEKPGPGDAGAIYPAPPPLKIASKPAGEWNRFRILHIGDSITVYLNGELVQDNVAKDITPGDMFGGKPGPQGPLMFQGDHSKVWYRNIRIRPLFGEGWKPLWNGKDLSEFVAGDRKVEDFWKVEGGAFTNIRWGGGEKGGCDLKTREPFGNFLLHYAYRSDPKIEGGNSGFYLRDQWEIQILRDSDPKGKHSDGALYSIYPPLVDARNGEERWNHMDVKVEGMKIWVWQNGKLIHDGRVLETRTDDHNVATKEFSKRPFKFQGDHGKVWFSQLYINTLPDSK